MGNRGWGARGTSANYKFVRTAASSPLDPNADGYGVVATLGTPVTLTTPAAKNPTPAVPAVFPQPQPPPEYGAAGTLFSSPGDQWEVYDLAGNAAAQNILIAPGTGMAFADGSPSIAIARNFSGYRVTVCDDALTLIYESLDQAPSGVQGPQGASGAQGPQGAAGGAGSQGPQGTQGAQGPQGATGTQGPSGGTQGPQGAQGPTGPSLGFQGPQGATGAQGPQGATGAQGPQGTQGVGNPRAFGGLLATAQVTGTPSGSFAAVAFTSNNPNSLNVTPTNPILTVNLTGNYLVTATVTVASDSATLNATLAFFRNAVEQVDLVQVTIPSGRSISIALDTILALVSGDEILLGIEQSSGSNVNFTISGTLEVVLAQ